MTADFRQVLRTETWQDHERVDAAMTGIDLCTVVGFKVFLRIHRTCFNAIQQVTGENVHASLGDLVERINKDLAMLGAADDAVAAPALRDIDPLAAAYVVEGSRLGSKLLKGRWLKAQDSLVRQADAYFSFDPSSQVWRETCEYLRAVPVGSERANTIIQDTRQLFDLFYDTIVRHIGPPKRMDIAS